LTTLNHDKTHVILITNGDFPNLADHSIPNVKANAEMLLQTLTVCVGIPEKNIHSFNDKSASYILKEFQKIIGICSGKEATLIAYYAGHGLPVSRRGLFWATNDTEKDNNNELIYSTAIPASEIKSLMEKCNAERKILISDCCYAADFLEGTQADMKGFMQKNITEIKGTFYMFSSDSDSESTFPVEKINSPTFFTDALVRSLKEGIEPEAEFCTIGKIYTKVEETIGRLRTEYNKHIPDPAKRIDGKADEYILYINPKYRNQEDIELEAILEDPTRPKLFNWMDQHPDHPRYDEAKEKLKFFDSAEEEVMKVSLLPAEQRSGAYLDLSSKLKKIPVLAKMARSAYGSEKGIGAQREQLDGSQSEDAGSIRTANDASARQV
jgi:Caspase domain